MNTYNLSNFYKAPVILPGPTSRKKRLPSKNVFLPDTNSQREEKGTDYIAEYVQKEEEELLRV